MSIPKNELNFDNAVGYHYDKFPPRNLDYEKLAKPLAAAAGAIARYDQMLKGLHNSEIMLAPLRNQEAVISSRMEGTVSTMDEILQYEAEYDEAGADAAGVRTEVIETILYQRTLRNAQAAIESGQPFSEHLIKAAHQQLLSWGRGATKSPGEYKNEQNYLADKTMRNVLFVPASPERLREGLDNLFKYINESDDQPLIKAAITHVEFEALHPFKDGNGRIGRMIITLMLWTSGIISAPHYYISGYFEENKNQYIDTMRKVSESDDWTGWCQLFLEAIEKQAIRNLQTAEDIRGLYEEMKIEFSGLLSSKYSVDALDFVFTNPVFRNNRFTKSGRIPEASAARFTRLLLDKGLITTVIEASGRRPAIYRFEPLMRLVRV